MLELNTNQPSFDVLLHDNLEIRINSNEFENNIVDLVSILLIILGNI